MMRPYAHRNLFNGAAGNGQRSAEAGCGVGVTIFSPQLAFLGSL